MKVEIIIEKDDNGFYGHIPELGGLHTCGDTIEETLKHVGDALSAYTQSMIKHKEKFNIKKKRSLWGIALSLYILGVMALGIMITIFLK